MNSENEKKAAAIFAAKMVENGMVIGLGTGSTTMYAIEYLAASAKNGLQFKAVASSSKSQQLANKLGIKVVDFSKEVVIDLAIDGADEIDTHLNMIKGGGGALVREKILAYHAKKWVVIVDSLKLVKQIGKVPLPVEVLPFGACATETLLQKFGQTKQRKTQAGAPFISDNGNLIIDVHLEALIASPKALHDEIKALPGVVDTGLFFDLADTLVVGTPTGLKTYT